MLTIMRDPVTAADVFSYDRTAIEEWLKAHSTSPRTGKPMGKETLPNLTLKTLIRDHEKSVQEQLLATARLIQVAARLRMPFRKCQVAFVAFVMPGTGVFAQPAHGGEAGAPGEAGLGRAQCSRRT